MNLPLLRTALRSLLHPASLASMVLLLLNNHLFKSLWPSWTTGKLSDLAGLFFIPFVFALLLTPLRGTPRRIGAIAFGIAGCWFAAAKGTVLGNALTLDLIEMVSGNRPIVLIDPTDLLTLVSLIPAWLLWRASSLRASEPVDPTVALPAVVLATVAIVAEAGAPEYERIAHLETIQGKLYAISDYSVHVTTDNGRTWAEVTDTAITGWATRRRESTPARGAPVDRSLTSGMAQVEPKFFVERQLADPRRADHLCRIAPDSGRIDMSRDSGRTWGASWSFPAERRDYAAQLRGSPMEVGPFDMALTPDSSGTLVVAMGMFGVVVRDSSGRWSEHSVGTAAPLGPSATNAETAIAAVETEWSLLFNVAVATGIVMSIVAFRRSARGTRREEMPLTRFVWWLLLFTGSGALYWGLFYLLATLNEANATSGLFGLLVLPFTFLALSIYWGYLCRSAEDNRQLIAGIRWWAACAAAAFVVPMIPMLLWSTGVIVQHETATWGMVVLWLAVVVAEVRAMRSLRPASRSSKA